MHKKRRKAYRNLINALLNCNEGEEWELLQAHQELIDSDFIQMMKQIAEELKKKGDEERADFLRNLLCTSVSSSAYQGIIEQLLNCASEDEAWQILDANKDWVDAGLTQTMLEVAEDLRIQGYLDKSNFLMKIVEQLMGVHGNTSDAQLDFLLQVLQATADSRGDKQVVYPLLADNTDKLNENLAELLRALATTTLEEAKPDQAKSIAADILNFSTLLAQFPLGDKASNMEIAITGYEVTLTVDTRNAFPYEWAMTQYNLGLAYSNRIGGKRAENIEQALACYQHALKVYTVDAFPYEWAMTQHNLGVAYINRIRGERAENIEQALACCQEALKVYTVEAFPQDWSETQNNLGAAYLDRIRGERAENIEQALACCQETLKVYTFDAFPVEWARTQHNLATAYRDRIRGERAENIEQAISCRQKTLKVRTFKAFPVEWAETQHNLATAYLERIRGDKAENLEQAIACCQEALKVFTVEAFPQDWAKTRMNIANAYLQRIRGERAENLEQALACYQHTLKVGVFEAFSQDWASTQNNLGAIYGQRIRGERAENLEQAIACCQEALKVSTFKAFPQNNAETLFNLGIAYQNTNQPTSAYNTFKSAIATVESLREEIVSGEESKRKQAEEWNALYRRMVEVCLKLGNKTEAIEYVERSKTRNLVEQILNRDLKTIFPADVVTQLEKYRDEIAIGQYKIQHGKAENQTALAQHLQELRQQRNELQNRYLPIGSGFQFEQFQNNLDDHTAIVEFYITGDKLLTFIFTHQTQQPIVWQSQPKDLDKLVKWSNWYFRAYYTKPNHWQYRLTTRLHLLAQILHIDGIIQQIPPEYDRLILIPHQFLHLFPLHALPMNSQQGKAKSKILMHRFPAGITYAPSYQLLELAQTRERPNFTSLFAIQNPTGDLSYTNIEVESIKSDFKEADVLFKNTATKAAIDSKPLNTFHCAHFSCHGYFNYEKPLKSALILADPHKTAPTKPNSERYLRVSYNEVLDLEKCLTLDAVFALKLDKCRLVTLSACETGVIDYTNISDEYIGLPSGFLVAGSPAVVSSLWTVNDLSTAFLMIKFYENLRKQMSLALALNQAQLWLRDATKEELQQWIEKLPLSRNQREELGDRFYTLGSTEKPFQEPYHWAAFCAIGQ